MRNDTPRRAIALILALAFLVVLVVLGVTFSRLMTIDQRAASSRVDEVRARFAALAGVEHAVSEIREASVRPWDGPDARWFYRGWSGFPAGNGVPLDESTEPSFRAGNTADGNPAIAGYGLGRPYSGLLPETYEAMGDTYVVRVLDTASMIDLNAPIDPRLADADQPFVRLLVNLCRALDPGDPILDPAAAVALLQFRRTLAGGRFDSKSQIRGAPGVDLTEERYERLAAFVTPHAWRDATTVAPMDPSGAPAAGDLVFRRIPTGAPIVLARSPVDVNTAPVEVLAAVLTDLTAVHVDRDIERGLAASASWNAIGRAERSTPISLATALEIGDAIVALREASPFRNWEDFRAFLGDLVAAGTIDALQAATILANADPNVNSHRSNPDRAIWRPIDKFDLLVSTTEFCFNAGGVFEIESLGRITAEGGQVVAQSRIRTVVRIYDVLRVSTQSDFGEGLISTGTIGSPTYATAEFAILTGGSGEVLGSFEIVGAGGSVHADGDLRVQGNPTIPGDATATGTYTEQGSPSIGGTTGGGQDPEGVPVLDPDFYRGVADYVYTRSGKVYDKDGNEVGDGSFGNMVHEPQNDQWRRNGNSGDVDGVHFFEGNVRVGGNFNSGTWTTSLIASGHVRVNGGAKMSAHPSTGILILAGGSVQFNGTAQSVSSGLIYASGFIKFNGNGVHRGPLMALSRHLPDVDGGVDENRFSGNGTIETSAAPFLTGQSQTEVPTLARYPEPKATATINGVEVDLASVNIYDGFIGLAPLTTDEGLLGAAPHSDRMLARWEGPSGLDAEFGGGDLAVVPDAEGPHVAPIVGAGPVGHLLRDGVYSEHEAVPGFAATGNLGALRGTLAFWFKPSWDGAGGPFGSTRSHHLVALSRTAGPETQSFQLAQVGPWSDPWSGRTGFHFERSLIENDQAQRLLSAAWSPPAHQWTHIAITWDLETDDAAAALSLYVDGEPIPGALRQFENDYELDPAELAAAAITTANFLRLGERVGSDYQLPGSSAEGTYDELISLPDPQTPTWIRERYDEGRYYNLGAAVFDSADLAIATGARVLHAAWTVRYPDGWAGPLVRLEVREAGAIVAQTTDGLGLSIDHVAADTIAYRLVFQEPPIGSALYETPLVDDVTMAVARTARLILWEE